MLSSLRKASSYDPKQIRESWEREQSQGELTLNYRKGKESTTLQTQYPQNMDVPLN